LQKDIEFNFKTLKLRKNIKRHHHSLASYSEALKLLGSVSRKQTDGFNGSSGLRGEISLFRRKKVTEEISS